MCFLFLFCLPYLSSIHEKANCIAILWTGSPHSLGSCLFRGLWATCLPHKGGASRKVPCPRTQQASLPACSPQPPLNAERQAGKLSMPFFKVFWYDSTRGMNPWSTDCEVDALTTTPSRRFVFDKPYIRGLCDPVGRIASYIHFGMRSALTKSSNRF